MRVAIGSDHAGFELKSEIARYLASAGHQVLDLGTSGPEPVDYPIFAEKVGLAVAGGGAERGILICGSGVGACVAANKIRGVRAALIMDGFSAHQGVEDDDMNVICLGGRVVGHSLALELIQAFLDANFRKIERFHRRLGKVAALELQEKQP